MDDSQYGGAVLLGLNGIVVVAHGRSRANAIRHAVRVAKQGIEQNLLRRIADGVKPVSTPVAGSVTGQVDDSAFSPLAT